MFLEKSTPAVTTFCKHRPIKIDDVIPTDTTKKDTTKNNGGGVVVVDKNDTIEQLNSVFIFIF